jgi:hypothetical protein
VFAPTKRRHVSYYLSLPFVIAFAFLLVAKLAALQRAEMVAQLADQVAHQEAPEAVAALRRLAAMPRPPVDILVATATSADAQLADEAQFLISGLLRQCQRKIDAGKSTGSVSRLLTELANNLEHRHEAFSRHDYSWLSGTTSKVLRLANQMAPSRSPQVAVQCDIILASIAANEARIASLVNRDLADALQPVATKGPAPVERNTSNSPTTATQQGNSIQLANRPNARPIRLAERSALPPVVNAPASENSTEPSSVNANRVESNQALEWTYPMLNIAPAIPIHTMSARMHASMTSIDQSDRNTDDLSSADAPPERPLATIAARDLLERWLSAEGTDLYTIEDELTYRGFGRLSGRLVEQLFSEDSEDRLRLVDDVLTAPGIDARPWLVLLAEDNDADVRLLVITIMATSDDPTLLERAWQVALHDRDPRIAGLAARLRERRDAAQRR